jgi:hypothetical protein
VFDSPHAHRAAAILGLPYVYVYPSAPPLYSLSWYAGALGLPYESPTLNSRPFLAYFEGFDDKYPDTDTFNAYLSRLDEHIAFCLEARQPYLTLFVFHPQLVRLIDFIDSLVPNGGTIRSSAGDAWPPSSHGGAGEDSAGQSRRLARWIRNDRRSSITVSNVVQRYGCQPSSMTREELLDAAMAISAANEILFHQGSAQPKRHGHGPRSDFFADTGIYPSRHHG